MGRTRGIGGDRSKKTVTMASALAPVMSRARVPDHDRLFFIARVKAQAGERGPEHFERLFQYPTSPEMAWVLKRAPISASPA